jgi:hypothetical protein
MSRFLAFALIPLFSSVAHAQRVTAPTVDAPMVAPRTVVDNAATDAADADNAWHVTLTIFRSPGTGLQIAKGHFAAFVAHYPTIIKRGGAQRNTNFVRVGLAAYARPHEGTSPYLSLSFAPSLTKGWSNSVLADVGARQRFGSRYSGQLGVALLYAPASRQTRFNPTVGLGVQF